MSKFSIARKKFTGFVLAAGLVLALAPAVAMASNFGPARPTFTWNVPATYVTFNSITDNPIYGDERKFLSVRDSQNPQFSKSVNVYDNEELIFQIYYHDNAASNYNLTATNTHVRFALPHTPSTSTYVNGHISADNANPGDVQDSADVTGANPFTLEYENGTAQIWNNVFHGAQLSDNAVSTSGALIGYNTMDGNIPGCAQYSGYVTIKVRVHMPTTPTPPVTPPTTPPTTPAKPVTTPPKALPNTGAGDVVGLFAGSSALGTAGHYFVSRRRRK